MKRLLAPNDGETEPIKLLRLGSKNVTPNWYLVNSRLYHTYDFSGNKAK